MSLSWSLWTCTVGEHLELPVVTASDGVQLPYCKHMSLLNMFNCIVHSFVFFFVMISLFTMLFLRVVVKPCLVFPNA